VRDGNVPPSPDMSGTAASPARFFVDAEYLFWWLKPGPNPTPLATNGSLSDTTPGALGQPGTTAVLLGGSNLNYNPTSGGRFSAGRWFGDDRVWGAEITGFFLSTQAIHQTVASNAAGSPGIFRPVNDVSVGEDAFLVAAPGIAAGSMSLASSTQLWGIQASAVYVPYQGETWYLALVGGFRQLELHETIDSTAFSNDFSGSLASPTNPGMLEPAGSTLLVQDRFGTSNQFYGGEVGTRFTLALGRRWYVAARTQVALGSNFESIDIGGSTSQTQPGKLSAILPAGLLATGSNSGHFTHEAFSVVPEGQLRLGCQLTKSLSGFIGYNFLYWSNVVRPGSAINNLVDERGIPTSTTFTPAFHASVPPPPAFTQSGFWAQGLAVGLHFAF
jgi:hypothetical protein